MNAPQHVEVVPIESAQEFIDYLRPSPKNWGPLVDHSCPWVYRGQSDADWRLVPTAWREEARAKLEPIKARVRAAVEARLSKESGLDQSSLSCSRERAVECMVQIETEVELVQEFACLADELGHPVPDLANVRAPRNSLSDFARGRLPAGPEPNIVFGFAQHHGMPTRLLDWTRKGLVAAFFAADGVDRLAKKGRKPSHFAVWGLNRFFPRNSNWTFLTCPRHQFAFLHAQDGLFTWLNFGDCCFIQDGVWPAFEERLEPWDASPKPLRKVTLPAEQADAVLQILWRERISRAHLMPTYDNVAASLSAKWQWNNCADE